MSVITNQLSSAFASPNVLAELESGGAPNGSGTSASPQLSDAILRGNPISLPIQSPVLGGGFGEPEPGSTGSNDPSSLFSNIMNEIGNIVNALLAQLLESLTANESSAPVAPTQTSGTEQLFSTAAASSNGDPHLTFDGTTASGASVHGKWDSMSSHADLLSSDSFAGGYRVSTTVGQPNAQGATTNQSATVTAAGGATAVTVQGNGSYTVSENGTNVPLVTDLQTALGNGETVELNSDGSLTIADANGQGGTISTTLKSTGGGVDVSSTANNVDLGGYLVDKSDNDDDPVSNGGTASYNAFSNAAVRPEVRYTPPGIEQFDPDYDGTSLSNIEYT